MLPIFHVIVRLPAVYMPPLVAETNVSPVGTTSVTTTFVALIGESFAKESVYVMGAPGFALSALADFWIVRRGAPTPTWTGALVNVPAPVLALAAFWYVPTVLAALAVKISVPLDDAPMEVSKKFHVIFPDAPPLGEVSGVSVPPAFAI